MYYIIQENLFNEEGNEKLIDTLNKFCLDFEIVNVSGDEDLHFKTDRNDVFVFGSMKLGRISKKYNWFPGSLITENHDFNVYKNYYKDNLVNYYSKIYKFGEDFEWKLNEYFISLVSIQKFLLVNFLPKKNGMILKSKLIQLNIQNN